MAEIYSNCSTRKIIKKATTKRLHDYAVLAETVPTAAWLVMCKNPILQDFQ